MVIQLIIGVAIIIFGVYKTIKVDEDNENIEYNVVVQSCKSLHMSGMPLGEKIYEIKVKLEDEKGFSEKLIKSKKMYHEGDILKVSKNIRTNIIVPVDNFLSRISKIGFLLIFGGVVWCIMAVLGVASDVIHFVFNLNEFYMILFILLSIILYFSIRGIKRKRNMKYCNIVEGELVKYEIYRDDDGDKYGPIYKFYYNGELVMFEGIRSVLANENIGKKVNIVVNEVTGDIYRLEEKESIRFRNIVWSILIGVAVVLIEKIF